MKRHDLDQVLRRAIIKAGERDEENIQDIHDRIKLKFTERKTPLGFNYINGTLTFDNFEAKVLQLLVSENTKEYTRVGDKWEVTVRPVISPALCEEAKEALRNLNLNNHIKEN